VPLPPCTRAARSCRPVHQTLAQVGSLTSGPVEARRPGERGEELDGGAVASLVEVRAGRPRGRPRQCHQAPPAQDWDGPIPHPAAAPALRMVARAGGGGWRHHRRLILVLTSSSPERERESMWGRALWPGHARVPPSARPASPTTGRPGGGAGTAPHLARPGPHARWWRPLHHPPPPALPAGASERGCAPT